MSERPLHAPWRMDYIRSLEKPTSEECFLCAAAKAVDEKENGEDTKTTK